MAFGYHVQGSGPRHFGSGFRVWDFQFRVQGVDSGFRTQGSLRQ